MKTSIDLLIYLTDLYRGIPSNTPHRYKFIHSLLTETFPSLSQGYLIDIPGFESDERTLDNLEAITPQFIASFDEYSHKFSTIYLPNKCHVLMPE